VTITEEITAGLRGRFPGDGLRFGVAPDPIVTIPARCVEVGELKIFDHGDEAVIHLGHVAHTHVSAYHTNTHGERVQSVAEDIIEFLGKLLADEILFWSVDSDVRMGGVHRGYTGIVPAGIPKEANIFLWSRRLK
jgi:hypothetical protein